MRAQEAINRTEIVIWDVELKRCNVEEAEARSVVTTKRNTDLADTRWGR